MYTIEVDVDGVLLDVHGALERRVRRIGYKDFKISNVKTYDFNKSLDSKFNIDLGAPRDILLAELSNHELFAESTYDADAIDMINEMDSTGLYKFIIHTLSYNQGIADLKHEMLSEWFRYSKNISIVLDIATDGEIKKSVGRVDSVIEDCHLNLTKYSNNTSCYLINKPWTNIEYNEYCKDILLRSNVVKVENAVDALNKIRNRKDN